MLTFQSLFLNQYAPQLSRQAEQEQEDATALEKKRLAREQEDKRLEEERARRLADAAQEEAQLQADLERTRAAEEARLAQQLDEK